jgi:CheY-like chemotaxis protein
MNNSTTQLPFRILIADDDEDDIQLTRDCFVDNNLHVSINDVADGQHLLDHLKGNGAGTSNLPQLILLDLNMPRKSGFEALAEIKADTNFRKIPVVIFTTSKAPKDIEKAYDLGASCFVSKPNTLDEWCDKLGQLGRFWIECVNVAV